jgi:hypothetical protein
MQWNGYYHDWHESVDHYQASIYCGVMGNKIEGRRLMIIETDYLIVGEQ